MSTTVSVNSRGGLTLPMRLRRAAGLAKGGMVTAELSANGLLLKPVVTFPIEMYDESRVAEFDQAEKDLQKHLGRGGKT
jgi:antitoxin PrlF